MKNLLLTLITMMTVACGQKDYRLDDTSFKVSDRASPELKELLAKAVAELNEMVGQEVVTLSDESEGRYASTIEFVESLPSDSTIGNASYGYSPKSLIADEVGHCNVKLRLSHFTGDVAYEDQKATIFHEVFGHCFGMQHMDIKNDVMHTNLQPKTNYERAINELKGLL